MKAISLIGLAVGLFILGLSPASYERNPAPVTLDPITGLPREAAKSYRYQFRGCGMSGGSTLLRYRTDRPRELAEALRGQLPENVRVRLDDDGEHLIFSFRLTPVDVVEGLAILAECKVFNGPVV